MIGVGSPVQSISSMKSHQNERNRRSTGPRSAAGKGRSAQNARRHGLSVPNVVGGTAEKQLVETLLGGDAEPHRLHFARAAAAAMLDLERVQRVRTTLINLELSKAAKDSPGKALTSIIPALVKLDRYEARAHARKIKALQFL